MSSSKIDDTLFSAYLDSLFTISHSANTVNGYKVGLNHFRRFAEENHQCTVTSLVDYIKAGKIDLFKVLNEFVVYLDKLGKQPQTIKMVVTSAKGILRYAGIKIYSEDFKQMVKIPKVKRHREEPLTKEILIRLLRNLPVKLQTAVLVASASGIRVGELVQIRISDIDFSSKPTKVKIRADITKTREARETFLTAEATKALKDYLERFFGWKENETNTTILNQMIFGRTSLVKNKNDNFKPRKKESQLRCTTAFLAEMALGVSLTRHIQKIPELSRLNENGRRMIHFHAFRKYFRTTVGDATNRDFAEALMGHRFYLDTYYNQSEDKRKEMYLKAEPYLTISDFVQVEKDLGKISEKQRELEEEQQVIKQFILKHYVGLPEFEKSYSLIKDEIRSEKPRYNVSCIKCGRFLGQSRSMIEGKQLQQEHSSDCVVFAPPTG